MPAAELVQVRHNAILLTINRYYRKTMTPLELYEMTRGIWRVGPRRNEAEYALALYKGKVLEVYRIVQWYPAGTLEYQTRNSSEFKNSGRWEFSGEVAPHEIRDEYFDCYVGKAGQNPIRYVKALNGIKSKKNYFLPEEINEGEALFEGAKLKIIINAYERNPEARRKCLAFYGTSCIICGFNFLEFYGEEGKDLIHVHHLRQLAEVNEEYQVDPINDLRPVCPNCHAMIHRRKLAYSLDEMKGFLNRKKRP